MAVINSTDQECISPRDASTHYLKLVPNSQTRLYRNTDEITGKYQTGCTSPPPVHLEDPKYLNREHLLHAHAPFKAVVTIWFEFIYLLSIQRISECGTCLRRSIGRPKVEHEHPRRPCYMLAPVVVARWVSLSDGGRTYAGSRRLQSLMTCM